ncbi:hypothetical protein M569_15474, partial [Genlisea aurea]
AGHFRKHPVQYRAAVVDLLQKAAAMYSKRIRSLEAEEGMGIEASSHSHNDPSRKVQKAASFVDSSDRLVTRGNVESSCDEETWHYMISASSSYPAKIAAVNGELLFGSCVPRNVEDWDVKSLERLGSGSRKCANFKRLMRSRL